MKAADFQHNSFRNAADTANDFSNWWVIPIQKKDLKKKIKN